MGVPLYYFTNKIRLWKKDWSGIIFHSKHFNKCHFLVDAATWSSKVWVEKPDTLKNWPLVKNLQFWFNLDQILSNWLSHLRDLLTKFHENWTKIVDFSLMAKFWTCADFVLLRPYLLSLFSSSLSGFKVKKKRWICMKFWNW